MFKYKCDAKQIYFNVLLLEIIIFIQINILVPNDSFENATHFSLHCFEKTNKSSPQNFVKLCNI